MDGRLVNNIKRELEYIYKQLKDIDRDVYRGKQNHTDAIVDLTAQVMNLVTVLNKVVSE